MHMRKQCSLLKCIAKIIITFQVMLIQYHEPVRNLVHFFIATMAQTAFDEGDYTTHILSRGPSKSF